MAHEKVKKAPVTRFSVSMDKDTVKVLLSHCKQEGRKKSQMLRRMILNYGKIPTYEQK